MGYSVGTKGQVVIPKAIRDTLQIAPGQEMVFEQRGDEIVMRKRTGTALRGRFAGTDLTGALAESRRDEREREQNRAR